jgi:hypothetical protein
MDLWPLYLWVHMLCLPLLHGSSPLGFPSSGIRRRFAVHVVQTFRLNVSFSPSGVQLSMKIGIDIPEDRKSRIHCCDVFRLGCMFCAAVCLLAPILRRHCTVCWPVLWDSATLFLVNSTSWLSSLYRLTWWVNCLRTSSLSYTTLLYNADLLLLNALLPVSSIFFYLSSQFVILQLLKSVDTQFHHLFFVLPLSRLPWG